MEVSERLVGSPAFKAGGMGDPHPAGSIPVHLRRKVLKISHCKKCSEPYNSLREEVFPVRLGSGPDCLGS